MPGSMQPRAGRPLGVLQVNTTDAEGGAARVMHDLHGEYLAREIDGWMAVGFATGSGERTLLIDNDAARSRWTRAFNAAAAAASDGTGLRRGAATLLRILGDPARYRRILGGEEDMDFPATAGLLGLPPTHPEILHLHNLHGYYFDMRELPRLSASVPTVLTMHDAWLLTGHCAHPFDCPRWRTGCGDCPDPGMYVPIRRDASDRSFRLKRDIMRRSRVRLAVPSRWLLRMVEESGLATACGEMRLIPNGVDTGVFRPGDALEARERLGLPPDRPIVLLAGHRLQSNPFKDFRTFLDALSLLPKKVADDVLVIALGGEGKAADAAVDVRFVPYVADAAAVAGYLRAADLFVHPARADNLPLAVIEASACGTAVVATDVGGIPEIVADGETGILVPPGDSCAMGDAMAALLEDPQRRESLGAAGTQRVLENFTLARQADAYIAWYEEMLSGA